MPQCKKMKLAPIYINVEVTINTSYKDSCLKRDSFITVKLIFLVSNHQWVHRIDLLVLIGILVLFTSHFQMWQKLKMIYKSCSTSSATSQWFKNQPKVFPSESKINCYPDVYKNCLARWTFGLVLSHILSI